MSEPEFERCQHSTVKDQGDYGICEACGGKVVLIKNGYYVDKDKEPEIKGDTFPSNPLDPAGGC